MSTANFEVLCLESNNTPQAMVYADIIVITAPKHSKLCLGRKTQQRQGQAQTFLSRVSHLIRVLKSAFVLIAVVQCIYVLNYLWEVRDSSQQLESFCCMGKVSPSKSFSGCSMMDAPLPSFPDPLFLVQYNF